MAFMPDKLQDIVNFANKVHQVARDQAFAFAFTCPPPAFQPVILTVPFYNGPEEEAKEFFKDILNVGPVIDQTKMMPYEELNRMLNYATTHGDRKSVGASAMKAPLDVQLIQEVFNEYTEFVHENEGSSTSLVAVFVLPYKKICSVP
jgi:hypothetical protein